MTQLQRMKELVSLLVRASYAYYNTGNTIMSDREFDTRLAELKVLEQETGIVLSNSPTHNVGAEVSISINEVFHNSKYPMLSLDKCHDIQELIDFAGADQCYLGVKCDGLSTRICYDTNGKLFSAETRGNGVSGSDVTFHIKQYENVPLTIPHKGGLVIDGESVIFQGDFDSVNENLSDENKFKNPRNLAAGTLANFDSGVTKSRHMRFIAWRVIDGIDGESNFSKLMKAKSFGFTVVPMLTYIASADKERLPSMLEGLRSKAIEMGLPLDGIVMAKDDVKLCESMGRTEKFFRHSIAYKFEDEDYPTKLLDIEWTVGKSATITPTAVFEPVDIEGSTVSRASLHNISIMHGLGIKKNCTAYVYKANSIIPQIRSCDNDGDENIEVPSICPVCGAKTEIVCENSSEVLVCSNPNCKGKLLSRLTHFVSRQAMNIKGLSEQTLSILIQENLVKQEIDLYCLNAFRSVLLGHEGFSKKKADNLLESIEKSRQVTLDAFINALSIPGVGAGTAKKLANYFEGDPTAFITAFTDGFHWANLTDVGEVVGSEITKYFKQNGLRVAKLADEMRFMVPKKANSSLDGLKFCITGSFSESREVLKGKLEAKGAKFISGVSKNIDVLFAGEKAGSKLEKARQLGIRVADENELLNLLKGE